MASPVERGLTVDYLDTLDDEEAKNVELIGGELFVMAPPTARHQRVIARLTHLLMSYEETHGGIALPEPGTYYSQYDYVRPDAAYFRADRLTGFEQRIQVSPDLLVEVSSPSRRRYDLGLKLKLYERHGVPEYWFVDLDAEVVMVHRLDSDGHYREPVIVGRGDEIRPPHLDGLTATVDEIFRS